MKTKEELIKRLGKINVQLNLEKNIYKKNKLLNQKQDTTKALKSITSTLNGSKPYNDKEVIKGLKLDLLKPSKLKKIYTLREDIDPEAMIDA